LGIPKNQKVDVMFHLILVETSSQHPRRVCDFTSLPENSTPDISICGSIMTTALGFKHQQYQQLQLEKAQM